MPPPSSRSASSAPSNSGEPDPVVVCLDQVVQAMRDAIRLNQDVVRAAREARRMHLQGMSWAETAEALDVALEDLLRQYEGVITAAATQLRQTSAAARSSSPSSTRSPSSRGGPSGSQSMRRASDQRRSKS